MSNPSNLSALARNQAKAKGADTMKDWVNEADTQKPQEEPRKRLNVDVPESLHRALKQKALEQDTSVRDLVVRALREVVAHD